MNRKKIRAQGLIEFALVIPLLIFIMLVFIDLGRAIFTFSSLSNAVREGTRYAIVHPTVTAQDITDIKDTVRSYAGALDPSLINFPTFTVPTSTNHYITIVVTYPYQPITPGLILILGSSNSITLRAQSSALTAPTFWN